jgi:hypothetical protein
MSRRSIRRACLATVVTVLLAGCQPAARSSSSTSDATGPATATATPTTTPTVAGTPVSAASPIVRSEPPAATLSVEGGEPVIGQLGTFTWGDGGSDSPWLPGSPIACGTGERLTVTVGDGIGVATWSARRVPAGATDASGAVGLGAGGPPVAFDAPPVGSWSVQVTVDFEGGLGSATYYWLVSVR